MIKKNIKLIIGFVIGLILTTGGVYAVNTLSASSISVDKTNMNKVPESNLQSALDYLYSKSKTNNMITIESGVKHETQTYLGIAYLDPTNLDTKCTAQNSVSTTGTKTGCMKWYIYKDLGDSYKMILDHNTTARQPWNTTSDDDKHKNGTNVAFGLNETGDSAKDNLAYIELMKLVSDYNWVLIPDIISAEEVAQIVGYSGFTNTNAWFYLDSKNTTRTNTKEGTSNYAWLFDNLGWSDWDCAEYGCNMNNATGDNITLAYWTKTTHGEVESSSGVWRVLGYGTLDDYYYASATGNGLRPVITVSKNLFN